MDITVPTGLSDIDKLIYLVRVSDKAENLTREGLYKVHQEGSWQGRFSSWGEFVESPYGLNKSQGWASKHLTIHKHYSLKGGLSSEALEGIATESLYLAASTNGTPEQQVEKARTLSRRALKESREDDGHVHSGEIVSIHKCCGLRID